MKSVIYGDGQRREAKVETYSVIIRKKTLFYTCLGDIQIKK